MGKNKLKKFAELSSFSNVFQNHNRQTDEVLGIGDNPVILKGRWSEIFQNENPITLELACGKGDYALAMARMNPDRNFIGIDIKGQRIHVGARTALEEGLDNVRFFRTQIDNLAQFFQPEEFGEIWITFPDPFLKEGRAKKRLTSPKFIEIYRSLLPSEHNIHLKTDSPELYSYTKEIIEELKLTLNEDIPDVYALAERPALLNIQTYYEKMHLRDGRTIRYLRFRV